MPDPATGSIVARLGDVAEVVVGGTPSTGVPAYWGGDVPWMSSGDVHLKRIEDIPGRITQRGLASSSAQLVEPPAVAIALAGQGKTRGTAALVSTRLSTNQSVALIRPRDRRLVASYLYHNLDARYEELRQRSMGGGRAGISASVLLNVPITLPTLSEQHRIAEVLDAVDAAIEAAGASRAKRAETVAAVVQNEIAGIGSAANHSLGEFLLQRPKNGFSAVEASDWTGRYILGLGCLTRDGFVPRQLKHAPSDKRLTPFLLRDGDVLMSRSNTRAMVGFAGVFRGVGQPCFYPDLMMRLVPRSGLLGDYLAIALNSAPVRRQVMNQAVGTSGSMVKITRGIVESLRVPIPSEAEQRQIVDVLKVSRELDGLDAARVGSLRSLKRGLVADLLSPELIPDARGAA